MTPKQEKRGKRRKTPEKPKNRKKPKHPNKASPQIPENIPGGNPEHS
jgi:hypothetical protein